MKNAAQRLGVLALLLAANPLPARTSARGVRAVHLLRAGRIDEADAMLRAALEADPKNATLATDLAFAEQLRGHADDAERLFHHAIELDPHRWYAYANLASMKAAAPLGAADRDALIALLERGQSLQKKSDSTGRAGLLLAMADVERAAGNFGAGRARLAEAERLALTASQGRRAEALRQALDAAEAKSGEARAAEEWPEPALSPELLAQLASAEADLSREPAAAFSTSERLSSLHPTWRGPRWLRARALIALEHLDAGTRELEALLRLDPANAAAWRLLGETLAAHGGQFEAERADAALRHALALEPAWSELWELRGRLLFRSGHAEEARRALEREEDGLREAGEPVPDELMSLLATVRAQVSTAPESSISSAAEPSASARALDREAQELLDGGDRLGANDRLSRALADSPTLIDAAILRWSLNGAVPEETARALWNDPPDLLRLVAAVRAQALSQALRAGETSGETVGAELEDAGAALDAGAKLAAAQVDAGAQDEVARRGGGASNDAGTIVIADGRAQFEAAAVAELVRPWIERAAELGDSAALLERARLRADQKDSAGALEDLGAAVAAGVTPEALDQARALRAELQTGAHADDATALIARTQLSGARPEDLFAELGGSCAPSVEPAHLIALGVAHELAGELKPALDCYRAALAKTPSDPLALTRLSRAAAQAPLDEIGSLAPELQLAAAAGVPSAFLAQARLLAAAGRADEALAAVDQFLSARSAPGFIEPGLAEAQALRQRLVREQARRGAVRQARLIVGIATFLALVVSIFLLFFRGLTVSRALRRDPSLFPAIARAVAEIRHDALKHRASALAMLGSAPREEIVRALAGQRPASALIADAYALLAKAADARGLALRRLRREPAFGPLFSDLRRAEEQLGKSAGPNDARISEVAARMQMHGERLSALLKLGPRTRLDAAVLASWIGGVEAELRAQDKPWSSPALQLQGLELDFPVAREPLAALFANLLRNAQAAAARAPSPRVMIRVAEERDVAGRKILELRIGDSSPEPLSLEQIEARESGRGLALVRELVREWQGHLRVYTEESLAKIGRRLFSSAEPMSAPAATANLPRVLVAEDGGEYTERFSRLLGAQFSFERVASFAELLQSLATPAAALVLDLDFRRTPRALLVDAQGNPASFERAAELAEVQGILILRALRARGEPLPALLCADLDDPERCALLCEELRPLQISPSSESLPAVAARLHALSSS